MDKIIVTVLGLGFIGVIYWFFFGKKSGEAGSGSARETKASWDILVSGGYKPSTITIPSGKKSTITLTRTDPNSCLEDVFIEDFKIKKFLPMNTPVTVTISPAKPGAYGMHCGMNMFRGRIEVV
jgi:plastocyanin domain-containing protein